MFYFRFVVLSKKSPILPDTVRLQVRGLSSAEVATALRPFYFLVHPDLFCQHPRAQHINDSSLKLLNNHLDLLIQDQKPSPVSLQFYVRNKNLEGLSLTSEHSEKCMKFVCKHLVQLSLTECHCHEACKPFDENYFQVFI